MMSYGLEQNHINNSNWQPWVCKQCHPKSIEFGMLFQGCSLVMIEDDYHILGGQGHGGRVYSYI